MEEVAIDSLKAAAFLKLNLHLISNSIGPKLKEQFASIGLMTFYLQVHAEYDSLVDVKHVVSQKFEAAKRPLFDSEIEKKSGFYDLSLEKGDSVIKGRVDSLAREYENLQVKVDSVSSIIDALMYPFDRFFMVVDIHDVLVKNIALPEQIVQAIQDKLEEEQKAESFKFRLISEEREAERKRIMAKGIKDFQDTIATGITSGLLKWKGIEATLQIAESENSKVIIIGAGEEGLPIILGNIQ